MSGSRLFAGLGGFKTEAEKVHDQRYSFLGQRYGLMGTIPEEEIHRGAVRAAANYYENQGDTQKARALLRALGKRGRGQSPYIWDEGKKEMLVAQVSVEYEIRRRSLTAILGELLETEYKDVRGQRGPLTVGALRTACRDYFNSRGTNWTEWKTRIDKRR